MFHFKNALILESIFLTYTRIPECSLQFGFIYRNNLTQLFPDL
jgi:hypothetical protein